MYVYMYVYSKYIFCYILIKKIKKMKKNKTEQNMFKKLISLVWKFHVWLFKIQIQKSSYEISHKKLW